MKKSLKKILIVALVATSGVAATGTQASAASSPLAKKTPTTVTTEFTVSAASGIRW